MQHHIKNQMMWLRLKTDYLAGGHIAAMLVWSKCINLVRPESSSEYSNGAESRLSTVVAPYFASEVISYECSDGFQPNLSNAPLTCTCMANANSDPLFLMLTVMLTDTSNQKYYSYRNR